MQPQPLQPKDLMTIAELKAADLWQNHYISAIGLIPFVQKLGAQVKGLEIGICRGENAVRFLEECPNIIWLDAVDPYLAYDDPNGGMTQEMMDRFLSLTQENFKPHTARIALHRMPSVSFAQDIPNGTYDYIFIDGDHSYDAVLADIRAWFPKMKKGGIFSGHDILVKDVQRAIAQFRDEQGISAPVMMCANCVWFWQT